MEETTTPGGAAAVIAEVEDQLFRSRPHYARRAGRHEFDGWFPSREALPDVAEIDRLRSSVAAQLRSHTMERDPELHADLDAAHRLLGGDRFVVAELGRAHPGLSFTAPIVSVWEYLRDSYGPLPDRLVWLEAHLHATRAYLDECAAELGPRVVAGERLRSMREAQVHAAEIGRVVDALSVRYAALVTDGLRDAASDAAAASVAFASTLEKCEPAAGVVGPELFGAFLAEVEGVEVDVGDLLAEAEDEVATLQGRLDALADRLGVTGLEGLQAQMAAETSEAPIRDAFAATLDRLRTFWAATGVVPTDTRRGLDVRIAPAAAGARVSVEFAYAGRHEPVEVPHTVFLPDLDDVRAGSTSSRRDLLNDPMLEIVAVHEVLGGHYTQVEVAHTSTSSIRTVLPLTVGCQEGWAHYAEELAIEHGLADGRPLVEAAQLWAALDAAMRWLIIAEVHTRRWRFADAVERSMTTCRWSADRARHEVLASVCDIRIGSYALGKLRIRAERSVAARAAGPDGLRAFHDAVLGAAFAPIATVFALTRHRLAAPELLADRDPALTTSRSAP